MEPIQFDNESIRCAINLYFDSRELCDETLGPIGTWDVSGVTDMSRLFYRSTGYYYKRRKM